MINMLILASVVVLTGCAAAVRSPNATPATHNVICIISSCEIADNEMDRIGDPVAGGDIEEQQEQTSDVDQQGGDVSPSLSIPTP